MMKPGELWRVVVKKKKLAGPFSVSLPVEWGTALIISLPRTNVYMDGVTVLMDGVVQKIPIGNFEAMLNETG